MIIEEYTIGNTKIKIADDAIRTGDEERERSVWRNVEKELQEMVGAGLSVLFSK